MRNDMNKQTDPCGYADSRDELCKGGDEEARDADEATQPLAPRRCPICGEPVGYMWPWHLDCDPPKSSPAPESELEQAEPFKGVKPIHSQDDE